MIGAIKTPHAVQSSHLLEEYLPRRYKVKRYTLDKYLTIEQVAMFMEQSPEQLVKRIAKSVKFHGVFHEERVWVHPDSAIKMIAKKYQVKITKSLKDDLYLKLAM